MCPYMYSNGCVGCICSHLTHSYSPDKYMFRMCVFFCAENMCISWLCRVRQGALHAATQNVCCCFFREALFSTQSLCFPHRAYVFHTKPMFSAQKPMFSTQSFCFPHRAYVFHTKPMFSAQSLCFPHKAFVFHTEPMFSTQSLCFPHKAYVFYTTSILNVCSGGGGGGGGLRVPCCG